MPLPDKYKERGAAMAQAFKNVMGFSIGGRIFDRLKKKKISELISEAREAKKDPLGLVKDKSVGDIADMVKFSKGGKIRKGSPAMKRKMARLRAMRK
jgi:hypothetical protein